MTDAEWSIHFSGSPPSRGTVVYGLSVDVGTSAGPLRMSVASGLAPSSEELAAARAELLSYVLVALRTDMETIRSVERTAPTPASAALVIEAELLSNGHFDLRVSSAAEGAPVVPDARADGDRALRILALSLADSSPH